MSDHSARSLLETSGIVNHKVFLAAFDKMLSKAAQDSKVIFQDELVKPYLLPPEANQDPTFAELLDSPLFTLERFTQGVQAQFDPYWMVAVTLVRYPHLESSELSKRYFSFIDWCEDLRKLLEYKSDQGRGLDSGTVRSFNQWSTNLTQEFLSLKGNPEVLGLEANVIAQEFGLSALTQPPSEDFSWFLSSSDLRQPGAYFTEFFFGRVYAQAKQSIFRAPTNWVHELSYVMHGESEPCVIPEVPEEDREDFFAFFESTLGQSLPFGDLLSTFKALK